MRMMAAASYELSLCEGRDIHEFMFVASLDGDILRAGRGIEELVNIQTGGSIQYGQSLGTGVASAENGSAKAAAIRSFLMVRV